MRCVPKSIMLAACLLTTGACKSNDQRKPDWLSPYPERGSTVQKGEQDKDRRQAIKKQVRDKEKLLAYEHDLASAQLDLNFAKRRLQLARERVNRLQAGRGEQSKSWWLSASGWKIHNAERGVKRAQKKVDKAQQALQKARSKMFSSP